jgi:glycosyltransferase involved in cell wall biosynthesis
MAWPLVSIIVPALNEAESLPELFARTDAVMRSLGQPYEFWVVDDGSLDATAEVAGGLKNEHPQIGLITHRANHGKSMALMQGFAAARGEIIMTMDADLQDAPEDIPKLLTALENGYDLAGGWRHERRDPLTKRLVSKVFNALIKGIINREFKDINCGFKAFTREVAACLDLHGDMHRLIPALAASFGFKTTEVPVSHNPRKYGESRYKLLRWRGLLDLISFIVLRATQVRPFHVMCKMSFLSLIASVMFFVVVWLLQFPEPTLPRYFFRFLCACLAGFFGAIALLAPSTGLIIECVAISRQDKTRRATLVVGVSPPSLKTSRNQS